MHTNSSTLLLGLVFKFCNILMVLVVLEEKENKKIKHLSLSIAGASVSQSSR